MPVGEEILRGLKRAGGMGGGGSAAAGGGSDVCRNCGYDLSGLDSDGRCPECGTAIRRVNKKRLGGSITDAPAAYLSMLAGACWLAMATSFASVVGYVTGHWWPAEIIPPVIWFASTLGWVLAVFVITRDRKSTVESAGELRKERRVLRLAALLLQCAFVISSGAALVRLARLIAANTATGTMPAPVSVQVLNGVTSSWLVVPAGTDALEYVSTTFVVVGLVGLGLLCLYLASLAFWARDDQLESRFRYTGIGLCVGVPLNLVAGWLVGSGTFVAMIAYGVALIAGAVALVSWVVFQWGLVQMALLSVAAISSAQAETERDRRMVERAEAARRAAGERQYVDPPPPVNLLESNAANEAPRNRKQGLYVERTGNGSGYDIAQ